MANEIATKPTTFSTMLQTKLEEQKDSLPAGFNIQRFTHNSIALLNGNDSLKKYAQQYKGEANAQIIAGLLRAAFLGLDALSSDCYLIPYGSSINFVTSYTGMIKMAIKYSQNRVKSVKVDIVKEGDEITASTKDGKRSLTIVQNVLSSKPTIGCLAQVVYADGDLDYEFMSIDQLEKVRSQSKARNSLAWSTFTEEMYKKVCIRRLLKRVTLDLDARLKDAFDSGIEIETDTKELAKREIAAGENSVDFIEAEAKVVM